ncbi:uncharacterized protein LOC119190158 [Manduca sexta]|uniref:uncharacterized protein LOC119190158 n=1 Tax=Manduca sexta TaxID=7130 RepID=UPI00188FC0E3|nr:uncharacterized protein LOC119190158 [Manduca sexta]
MSDNKNIDNSPERKQLDADEGNIAPSSSEVSSIAGSVKTARTPHRISSSSERQIKFERAQNVLKMQHLCPKGLKSTERRQQNYWADLLKKMMVIQHQKWRPP